eukprot:677024-Pyramimonas_sp.AAC.1
MRGKPARVPPNLRPGGLRPTRRSSLVLRAVRHLGWHGDGTSASETRPRRLMDPFALGFNDRS